MKLIYIILTFVTLASADLESRHIDEADVLKTININQHVDNFIPGIAQLIVKQGLDPYPLPSTVLPLSTQSDSPSPLASRKLTLNSGILKHLSRLERHGDATVTYEDKKIKIEVGVNFKSLEASYDYILKILFTRRGHMTVTLPNVRVKISVTFDTTNYTLTLNKFEVEKLSTIGLTFRKKNGRKDVGATIYSKMVISYLKRNLPNVIQTTMTKVIQNAFDEINRKISPKPLTYFVNMKHLSI